jgi:hypothetical protein
LREKNFMRRWLKRFQEILRCKKFFSRVNIQKVLTHLMCNGVIQSWHCENDEYHVVMLNGTVIKIHNK